MVHLKQEVWKETHEWKDRSFDESVCNPGSHAVSSEPSPLVRFRTAGKRVQAEVTSQSNLKKK